MKKLIIVMPFVLLTVWIAPNFSVYATPNDITLNESNIISAKVIKCNQYNINKIIFIEDELQKKWRKSI